MYSCHTLRGLERLYGASLGCCAVQKWNLGKGLGAVYGCDVEGTGASEESGSL